MGKLPKPFRKKVKKSISSNHTKSKPLGISSNAKRITKGKTFQKAKQKHIQTAKKSGTKRTSSKPDIEFSKKRGDNQISLNFRQRGFDNKIKALRSNVKTEFDYLLKKNKPKGAKTVKPPKAVMIVLKIKKPGEPGYYYNSKVSDPDFVVNKKNIVDLMAQSLSEYNNNMADIAESYDEPTRVYNVQGMAVRFLY